MEERELNFYREVSREKRRELLDEILKIHEKDHEELRILEYIWELRFGKNKAEDYFQDALLELLHIDEQMKTGKNQSDFQQKIFHLGQMLGLDDYRFQTERGRQYFVLEYQNLAGCFIDLRWKGKTDKNYVAKIKNEIEIISVILPQRSGLSGLYKPLAEGMKAKVKKMYAEKETV